MIDADTANAKALKRLNTVANSRIHGTAGKVPAEFLLEELPHLQALPPPWHTTTSAPPANVISIANMKGSFQPPLQVFDDVVALAS